MANPKIIYADDDLNIRKLFSAYHEKTFPGIECEFFSDGTSLDNYLMSLKDSFPSFVVTDNNMPGVNGNQLIGKYAQLPLFDKTSFVLHYGGNIQIGEDAIKSGAKRYFQKPSSTTPLFLFLKEGMNLSTQKEN